MSIPIILFATWWMALSIVDGGGRAVLYIYSSDFKRDFKIPFDIFPAPDRPRPRPLRSAKEFKIPFESAKEFKGVFGVQRTNGGRGRRSTTEDDEPRRRTEDERESETTNEHCNYFRWFADDDNDDDDDDDDDITSSIRANDGPPTDSRTEEINDLRRRVGEYDRRLQRIEKIFKAMTYGRRPRWRQDSGDGDSGGTATVGQRDARRSSLSNSSSLSPSFVVLLLPARLYSFSTWGEF
ncbi:hypothetical protein CsSME_00047911 [Camellia sinensis var. sinensis]